MPQQIAGTPNEIAEPAADESALGGAEVLA
jgi:hypothetical protein